MTWIDCLLMNTGPRNSRLLVENCARTESVSGHKTMRPAPLWIYHKLNNVWVLDFKLQFNRVARSNPYLGNSHIISDAVNTICDSQWFFNYFVGLFSIVYIDLWHGMVTLHIIYIIINFCFWVLTITFMNLWLKLAVCLSVLYQNTIEKI